VHAEHAIAALGAGSHVLCEKPMATQVHDAERMVAAARHAGRVLAVGMVRRMFPCLADARDLLSTGALGDQLRFVYREGTVYGWPARTDAAFRRATAGGGVLTDLGSHVFDFLFALFGAPTGLSYADDGQAEGVETNGRVELNFARAQGVAQLSWSQPLVTGLHIVGSNAEIRLDPGRIDSVLFRPRGGDWEARSSLRTSAVDLRRAPRMESPSTYYACILHQVVRTLRAAIYGEPVGATAEDGLAVVRTIESCYREATSLQLPWLTPAEQERADDRHWNRVRWAA